VWKRIGSDDFNLFVRYLLRVLRELRGESRGRGGFTDEPALAADFRSLRVRRHGVYAGGAVAPAPREREAAGRLPAAGEGRAARRTIQFEHTPAAVWTSKP
jgi:hypothetical protein